MIAHNCTVAAAAAPQPQAQNQPAAGPVPNPNKRRKLDAGTRYAAWSEKTNDPVSPSSELAKYLTEPIGDDSDLLMWWQINVSTDQISTFIS